MRPRFPTSSALIAAFCCAQLLASSARAADEPLVFFRGNLLFNEWVYRALLEQTDAATANPATAKRVRATLSAFLRRAGYTLATVKTRVEDGRIAVDVDEGQLDKMVLLGVGAWDSVRFHLELELPDEVYNRPLLDQRLDALCKRHGLLRCTATLLEVDPQPGNPFGQVTIDRLEELGGGLVPEQLVRAARAFELQVTLEQKPSHSGFWPVLDVGGQDGVKVGANGYLAELPLAGGSTELKLRVGGNFRGHLDSNGSSPVFTRATADARIRFPAYGEGRLRPALGLLADLSSGQRGDLGVDVFYQARLEVVAVADFTPLGRGRELEFGLGLGLRRNFIFGLGTVAPVDPIVAVTPGDLFRPFVLFFLRSDLSPNELRWDRHHQLEAVARLRTGAVGVGGAAELAADTSYQKYFGLGWHEFWIRGHGTAHLGDTLYPDESSLGGDLRGALGDTFVRKSASVLTEFRHSLVRDLLKVSVFDSLVAFGRISDRVNYTEAARGALAVGLGIHGLLWTVVAVDLYGALAWSTDGRFGTGIALEVHEAYR